MIENQIPYVNLVVGVNWKTYENVFSDGTWYTRAKDEVEEYKNRIRLIIFYTIIDTDKQFSERQVIGCFAFPNFLGNAVREPIDNKFILAHEGPFASFGVDDDFSLRFFVSYKLPYLSSKQGDKIWKIGDNEALSILKETHKKHLLLDSPETKDIINVLELLIDEIEGDTEKHHISPELEEEIRVLPSWLRDELDSCDTNELPLDQSFVKKLLGRAVKNHLFSLQAAALQIKLGDYKFLISLANYCYSKGFTAFNEKNYSDSAQYFLEAANLYHRDPMITGTGWKQLKRSECISRYINAHVQEVLDTNAFSIGSDETSEKVSPRITKIRKHLPPAEIQKQILVSYYSSMGWHLYRNNQSVAFINFIDSVGSDLLDDLPPELLAIYYDQMADKFSKKSNLCHEDFVKAANYKEQALSIYKRLYSERQSDQAKVGLLERSVDYYKLNALAASCENDIENFTKYTNEAIEFAQEVYEFSPTEFRKENIHFLTGMKYGELTKFSENNLQRAEYHALARDEFSLLSDHEGHKRFLFHQLWHYYYLLRDKIGSTDRDFEKAHLVSKEALEAEWSQPSANRYLPNFTLDVHKGLHFSIATFGKDISEADLNALYQTIQILEAKEVKPAIRKIANLVYGIQLIRSCGFDERIIGETVKAIRSAIRQLLESDTISTDDILDELYIEKERLVEEENEQAILSKLRRRKLEEDFSIEAKECVCDLSSGKTKFAKSIFETVVAFLNSSQGGHIFVGVKDDTYEIVGIESDLKKYNDSHDQLKQALINHIHDHIPLTAHKYLPGISITYPVVEGHTLMQIKIPAGTYDLGLYVDTQGIAYIRKDGRLQRVSDPIDKDELSQQKRDKRGIWALVE